MAGSHAASPPFRNAYIIWEAGVIKTNLRRLCVLKSLPGADRVSRQAQQRLLVGGVEE